MSLLSKLDPWMYRYAFEGTSARRYARLERCAFGDLDERLIRAMDAELRVAKCFLDVGCGPATLAARVARTYPSLVVIGAEPSRDFTRCASRNFSLLRARAEVLPVATDSVDAAVYLSSIRHVQDRATAFVELRRVVRPGGVAYIVELDPVAGRRRCREHTRGLRSVWSKLTFGALVMRTAPAAHDIAALATAAGFADIQTRADPVQPVYIMRLGG